MLNANSPRHSLRLGLLARVCILALFSAIAFAQTTVETGSIVGTVTDSTGAVVTGAKVTITGPTGQIIKTTTGSAGAYASGNLVPGAYTVRIEAKGFKTAQLPVEVRVDNTANGSVKVEAGQEGMVVKVQAREVQVNTEQATVQGLLTGGQIENLPVNGRNFLDLAQLEPGVQIQDGENFDLGYSSISFGGRFGRTARINVDGVDVSDETVGTTTEDIPASSIQEFSLAQSSLDLSNDLTSSGAVNVTTKFGTNAVHGEAYGAYRDSSIGSAALPSPINPATANPATGLGPTIPAPFQRNQEGGNLGGPVIKDKLFFFVDGERTLQHLIAPVAETGSLASYSGSFAAPFKEDELMARLDYSLSQTARLFGRFNYFDNSVYATFFPSSFQVYNNKDYTRNEVFGMDFNTGVLTHTVRFSYLKFENLIVDGARGSSLPFANYPVSINIGTFTVGPNLLAPQSTPQSDRQIKYDGSRIWGKHIIRFGGNWNRIQGGGFASFSKIDPQVYGTTPFAGTGSDPTTDTMAVVQVGNGQGFSTTAPALGYPAGGLGPDNRTALYFGDTWKMLPNLMLSLGLRWERDTGRTDSDLPALDCNGVAAPCVPLNSAFPGWGNRVNQPNRNFAPQFGFAWDPKGDGKTSIRSGIGLYYENVIYDNVLFDRPLRLKNGAFLQYPYACSGLKAQEIAVPGGTITVDSVEGADPVTGHSYCADTIGQAANALAAFQNTYQADTPFSLTAANPSYLGTALGEGLNEGTALFAPNYRTPRALQMNIGIQRELRHGIVLSADFLRNVETHGLLGVDINQVGAARHFNAGIAQTVVNTTLTNCGVTLATLSSNCQADPANGTNDNGVWVPRPLGISDFTGNGLGTSLDFGSACPPPGCAFGGINPLYGQMEMLESISRSVYNALQMKLVENVTNPMPGLKAANFQVSYSFSRFVNPMGFQGNFAPSNPVGQSDQDFALQASDNDHPLMYMGPSLLDRTHQISLGGNFDVPWGFRLGLIAHFYSPLSSPAIVGDTGTGGQIFQTDFTGSGSYSDPLPGTKNGAYGRQFGVDGLNAAISTYNTTYAGQATPAGQVLINSGVFGTNPLIALSDLQTIGAVAPRLLNTPIDPLVFPWLKATDFRVAWRHTFAERFTIEPNVGFYNVFNLANTNLPPAAMSGWLNEGAGSINSVQNQTGQAMPFRVGAETGVFGLGSPRTIEWGLKFTF